MTVRREIAELRRETGARRPEDPMFTHGVRRGFEGRARRPKARRTRLRAPWKINQPPFLKS